MFNRARWLLLLIVAAAFGVRLYRITERSFWFDEAFSWSLACRFSIAEMVERTGRDVHPPFYYLLLRGWAGLFGDSVLALRSLSVLLGVATVVGMYGFCREAFRGRPQATAAGLLAAALLAASATHIRFSWETRMYTLATALVVCSSWLLLRGLRPEPPDHRTETTGSEPAFIWPAYTCCAAALVYTHNYGLFLVAGQVLFLLLCLLADAGGSITRLAGDRRARRAVTSVIVVGILYLPWLPVLLAQTARVKADYWIQPIGHWSVPNAWFQLIVPSDGWHVPRAGVVGLSAFVLAIVTALAWRGTRGEWLVFTLAAVPTLLPVLVSLTTVSIIEARHFLFCYLFVICAVAGVVFRHLGRPEGWLVAAVLIGDQAFVYHNYWKDLGIGDRPGIRGAVGHIRQQRRAGEPIVVRHPCIYFSVLYTMRAEAAPRLYLPARTTTHYTGGPILTDADCIGPGELAAAQGGRVWMLDTTGFTMGFTRPELPPGWKPAGESASFRDVYWFQGSVTVTPYKWTAP